MSNEQKLSRESAIKWVMALVATQTEFTQHCPPVSQILEVLGVTKNEILNAIARENTIHAVE
jgi:hypothetical protein